MKCAIREIDRGHFTRCPRRPAAPRPSDPLDAEVYCADEVIAVQRFDDTTDRLAILKQIRLQVSVIVADRTGVQEDYPAIVIHNSGDLVIVKYIRNREDCRYRGHVIIK